MTGPSTRTARRYRRARGQAAADASIRRNDHRRDFFAARMIDGICGGRVFGARAAARDERGHLADAERRAWTFGHAAPHHLYAPAYGATCRAIDILAARVEIRGGALRPARVDRCRECGWKFAGPRDYCEHCGAEAAAA